VHDTSAVAARLSVPSSLLLLLVSMLGMLGLLVLLVLML
jgi:hypothetical protein